MSNETPPSDELPIEEEIKKKEQHAHQGAEAVAVASGVAAGALMGSVAGPPGTIAGAVVGGVVGAVAGFLLDAQEKQRQTDHIEADRQSVEEDEAISRRATELATEQEEEKKD